MKLSKEGIAVIVAATTSGETYKPTVLSKAVVEYLDMVTTEVERYAKTYSSDLETTFPAIRQKAIEAVGDLPQDTLTEVEENAGAILYSYWHIHGASYYNFLKSQR